MKPLVVYHIASMGNWKEVVKSQFQLLKNVGLYTIIITHVGHELDWIRKESSCFNLTIRVSRSDPNTDHYETFGMLEVERLAKQEKTNQPILYMHTKGVSAPGHEGKAIWRKVMEDYVIRNWEWNIQHIRNESQHDVIGFNWLTGTHQHFSGNFWIANPNWIRKLPDFAWYHGQNDMTRFTCEKWIGSTDGCRAYSLATRDYWSGGHGEDFAQFLPAPVLKVP